MNNFYRKANYNGYSNYNKRQNKKINTRSVGDSNEQRAAEFMEKEGYRIVARNFRNRYGEIDIIAIDGNTLAFVEVKYRSSNRYGFPLEAVDYRKQQTIISVARYFMMLNNISEDCPIRFDIVAILGDDIEIVKDAFGIN